MSGRPELNNMELVGRAMRTILVPIQNFVIIEMNFGFGLNWWKEKILPDKYIYMLPDSAPTDDNLPEEVIRSYLDVVMCLKIIGKYKLVPKALYKRASEPLTSVRELRNILDHEGRTDYSMYEAQDAIRKMIILDEIFEFGCHEDLHRLYLAAMYPMVNGSEPAPKEQETEVSDVGGSSSEGQEPGQRPVPKETTPDSVTKSSQPRNMPTASPAEVKESKFDDMPAGTIGIVSSIGYESALEEKKELDRSRGRYGDREVGVEEVQRKGDSFILVLSDKMTADESLTIRIGNNLYRGAEVGYRNGRPGSKSMTLYPGARLREALENASASDISLQRDPGWLVQSVQTFYETFGEEVRYPSSPMSYSMSRVVSSMDITDEQRAAVEMAMSEPLSYVWGVPGSGKTQSVLAASICECVGRQERVAILAPTNVALEQILRGLSKAFDRYPELGNIIDRNRDILRVGTPTYEFARDFPNFCESSKVRDEIGARREEIETLETVILERGYESVRAKAEDAAARAQKADRKDDGARKGVYNDLQPLLKLMSKDPRYRLNASRVKVSNVLDYADPVVGLVYGHDRSDLLGPGFADMTDGQLMERISRLDDEIADLTPRIENVDLTDVKVVAMTVSRFIISFGPSNEMGHRKLDVDHVFIDEAGYCNVIHAAAAFTLGVPVTMLGDHMQLPPVCEVDKDDLGKYIDSDDVKGLSFLWSMTALHVTHLLDGALRRLRRFYLRSEDPDFYRIAKSNLSTTFRFGPNLAGILEDYVYREGISSASRESLDIEIIDATLDRFPMRNDGSGKMVRSNVPEAEAVWRYVEDRELDSGDFIVLTPYNDQIRTLKSLNISLSGSVMTIHRSQGREWDTVIVSVCDGHANVPDSPPRFTSSKRTDSGFSGLQVVNTALSRAKSHLVIVCDTEYWGAQQGELIGELVREYYRPRSALVPVHEPVGDERPLVGQRYVVEAAVVRVALHAYQPVGRQLGQVVPAVLLLRVELVRHGLVRDPTAVLRLLQDEDQDVPSPALDRRQVRDVGHGDLLQLLAHRLVGPPVHVVYRRADEEGAGARGGSHQVRPSRDVYREDHALAVLLLVDAADGVDDLLEVEPGHLRDAGLHLEPGAHLGHVLRHVHVPVAGQQVDPVDPGAYRVHRLRDRLRGAAYRRYVDVHGPKKHLTVLEFSQIHPKPSTVRSEAMIIGIDFGTCYSSAAIMNGLIPVTNFIKDTTGMGIPSLFMYSGSEGRELYGEQCLTGAALRTPADVIRNMKRTVREDPTNLGRTVASGGREFTVGQVIEKFLAYLVNEIRVAAVRSGEYRSSEIEAVTITAPVGIASGQMMASEYNRLLQDTVCSITGLERDRVRVLQEPVAAAISYLYSEDIRTHYDSVQRVLVFDLGGGTLDVSIVEHDPSTQEYRILAKEGDLKLGGNDWDAALAEAVLGKLGITWEGTDEERARFDMAVTKLKALLSDEEEQMIVFFMGGRDYYTRVTRGEFEECTRPLLERAMAVVERALEFNTDLDPTMAVLVGGSSNMPQIARGLVESGLFDDESIRVYEPSKAIAKGAAVYAKMNFQRDGPARGPRVLDMAGLTYGFESLYGGERRCIYNMIYKGTPFENGSIVRRSDTDFIPQRDDQTCVEFNVFESECQEEESFDGNWFDMGNGETFNGLRVTVQVPPAYLGRASGFRMWATLELDENGILGITITDRGGNRLGYASTAMGGEL